MPKIIYQTLTDALPFADVVKTNVQQFSFSDTLDFTETINEKSIPLRISLSDKLNFNDNAIPSGVKHNISLSDTISFSDKAKRYFQVSLHDFLVFTQSIEEGRQQFIDHLVFTETVTVNQGTALSDTLEFIETVKVNKLWSAITLTDTLGFSSYATGLNLKPNQRPWDFIATPQVPLSFTFPRFTTLTNSFGDTVQLRTPSFNNKNEYKYNIIKKETRGRDLILAPNSTYPQKWFVETLSYEIEFLNQLQGKNLFDFLNRNLGLLIQIIDFEGTTWNCIVVTPEPVLSQKDRANYAVSFDFEFVNP